MVINSLISMKAFSFSLKSDIIFTKKEDLRLDIKRFLKDALYNYIGVYVGTLIYYAIFDRASINLVSMITSVIPVTLIVILVTELYGLYKRKKK